MSKSKITILKLSLILFLISLDHISKYLASQKQWPHSCNPYISWSIPLDGWYLMFFIFLALVLLFYIAKNSAYHYSTLLIIAGALGNLIDRFRFKCVFDFLSFAHTPWLNKLTFLTNFPTFNLADVFITVGVLLFFYREFKKNTKTI